MMISILMRETGLCGMNESVQLDNGYALKVKKDSQGIYRMCLLPVILNIAGRKASVV